MSVRTNRDRLVMQSVMGKIHHPTVQSSGALKITNDGRHFISPSVGGITYNVKIGDSVYAYDCDHVEPGVSIRNEDRSENAALCALACIGNEAVVVSGEGRGSKGIVTGFHGGIEHTIIYFNENDLQKFLPNDQILIKAYGQGLKLLDLPSIICMGIDPNLLDKMEVSVKDNKLTIKVAKKIPSHLMGAGNGMGMGFDGDWDLMTADRSELKKYGLHELRYGDIVLMEDCDTTYGRGYFKGAVSVGVVVHSDSVLTGHGPGISTLFSTREPIIQGIVDEKANLADILDLK